MAKDMDKGPLTERLWFWLMDGLEATGSLADMLMWCVAVLMALMVVACLPVLIPVAFLGRLMMWMEKPITTPRSRSSSLEDDECTCSGCTTSKESEHHGSE